MRIFSLIAFLESLIALFLLANIPSDIKNSIFLGFSSSRLILIVGVLGISALAVALFFAAPKLTEKVDAFFTDPTKLKICIWLAAAILIAGVLFFCTPSQRMGEALQQRFVPVIALIGLISLQSLALQFVWTGRQLNLSMLAENRNTLRNFGFVLAAFLLLWVIIVWSGLGIEREPTGWLSPGTPILPQQLMLSAFVGLLFFVFRAYINKSPKIDLLIAAGIWLLAGTIWWLEPMLRQSYFSPEPTPPNFEYYPYSDAAHYDWFAQNILIGESRNIGLTHRPLYSLGLALLHSISGSGLYSVLFLQVFFLAIIPSIAYLLVSRLGTRAAGIMAALLLIIRERNSIALTNIIEVSHVKLIMSDVPTMFTMVLFIYFFIKWFQKQEDKYVLGLVTGASLGLSIFIRSQAQLLIPIALVGIVLIEKFKWRSIFPKVAVFLCGVLIIIAPWVWRNYQLSGRMIVEYLDFYTRLIASSYSSSPAEEVIRPGETDEQYRDRVKQQVIEYIVDHPLEVSRFYLSYFLHNEIASVTYLPMSFKFETIYRYVDVTGFWDDPYLGEVPFANLPALFLVVCVIAYGIGVTFQRFRWLGLMPLFFHLGYSFSSIFVRQSGWRFILPVDWVAILYFCIGLTELSFLAYSMFSKRQELQTVNPVDESDKRLVSWKGTGVALASFAFLGIAIPLIEWSIPERYPTLSNNVLTQRMDGQEFSLGTGDKILLTTSELENFLETESGATIVYGRALYPSYYEAGDFWGEASENLLEASKYNRLQFNLIGNKNNFVFIPLEESPQYFPHASDVYIIGCLRNTDIRALVIKVDDSMIGTQPWHGLTCKVTE